MTKQEIIERLVAEENGATGLRTPAGRVDVATPTHAIQVERIQHWRMAIGLAVAQKPFFPGRDARVHLFGTSPSVDIALVQAFALENGVALTMEGW